MQVQEKTGCFFTLYLYLMPRVRWKEPGFQIVHEPPGWSNFWRPDCDRKKSPWDNHLRPQGAPRRTHRSRPAPHRGSLGVPETHSPNPDETTLTPALPPSIALQQGCQ